MEQYLEMGGVSDPCAGSIRAALARDRVVSPELLAEIRAQLSADAAADPAPGRRTGEQILAVFTRVAELLELDRGSVVRQVAAGLTAAGYQGIEVTGPMGQTMAFVTRTGVRLEVAAPGTDSAPVLELVRDLASFHLGSSGAATRDRLVALGVAPEQFGAGRRPGKSSRARVQARPGTDLVEHAHRWLEDYGSITGFAHATLAALDCTGALGRAEAFLPPAERFARVRVGTPDD